ncbi:MAG: permease-like cell division protein FtsX [Lachnoclostridium sp.]|nr:permease-like cell division protein FtsX [Lachnoclostridium sp.]
MGTKKRHNIIPLFSTRVTATISVAMVLLLVGLAAFIGVAAHNVENIIRENTGFTIVLADNLTASQTDALRHKLDAHPAVARVVYNSPDATLERWKDMMGDDIEALAGLNPFAPEFEVNVKAAYAHPDSIAAVVEQFEDMPEVDDIAVVNNITSEISSLFDSLELILIIIAAALLLVSLVLISNTVRLAVYSRRFAIHTMKLVGATPGFIRRPFLTSNMVNGLIAGLAAALILSGILYYLYTLEPQIDEIITPVATAVILGAIVVAGVLICLVTSAFATNKYIRQNYDDMFK